MNAKSSEEDYIDLRLYFIFMFSKSKFISILGLSFSLIFLTYSLLLPNIYTSTAILAPSQQNSSVNNSLSRLGGLSSLAGIDIPSSTTSQQEEAFTKLSSYDFFNEKILPKIALHDLMAVESWNENTNIIEYDKNIYNLDKKEWVSFSSNDKKLKPSNQDAFRYFKKNTFSYYRNEENNFLTISINHQSPYIAKSILENIIVSINETFRYEEKEKAQFLIDYFKKQIKQTSLNEIKQGLSVLIIDKTETLALIEANKDYVFKIIDSPQVSEIKSSPHRFMITLFGLLIGLIIGAIRCTFLYFKETEGS